MMQLLSSYNENIEGFHELVKLRSYMHISCYQTNLLTIHALRQLTMYVYNSVSVCIVHVSI